MIMLTNFETKRNLDINTNSKGSHSKLIIKKPSAP